VGIALLNPIAEDLKLRGGASPEGEQPICSWRNQRSRTRARRCPDL